MPINKRILLVDDEEVITFGFSRVLAAPEVAVDLAHTVNEAQALMSANRYDAAIIDLRLSNSTEMEGFDLVTYLRSRQKACRIMVLTAYGEDGIRAQAMAAGADLFYEKPIEPESIKNILRSYGIYGAAEGLESAIRR